VSTVVVALCSKQGRTELAALAQVGALALRRFATGDLQVLLVTSRETKRWVIPKGWPWRDTPDHTAAANEAREEAGIIGDTECEVFGAYRYMKRRQHDVVPVIVNVFRMKVLDELATWPEAHQRERAWFSLEDAAAAVDEDELRDLIQRLAEPGAAFV
jgi:8-oxo-dGTP pyrophosphatase MutT (NUDIX family)